MALKDIRTGEIIDSREGQWWVCYPCGNRYEWIADGLPHVCEECGEEMVDAYAESDLPEVA